MFPLQFFKLEHVHLPNSNLQLNDEMKLIEMHLSTFMERDNMKFLKPFYLKFVKHIDFILKVLTKKKKELN